jgi:hypothetical protein
MEKQSIKKITYRMLSIMSGKMITRGFKHKYNKTISWNNTI